MCQEILQTQRSNFLPLPTSTLAVLHLCGLKAWQDTWQGKLILQRAPTKTCPGTGGRANRKAISAVKIQASFSSRGRKHILGAAAASGEDTLIERNVKGEPGKQDAGTPGLSSPTCQTGLSAVQLTAGADLGHHLHLATYCVALCKLLHLSVPQVACFLIVQI